MLNWLRPHPLRMLHVLYLVLAIGTALGAVLIAFLICMLIWGLLSAVSLGCGTERWSVKTLVDADAAKIDRRPVDANIIDLLKLPNPARALLPENGRLPQELHVYRVTGVLVGFKRESDEDFHIVIADPNDPTKTMIVEMPAADCTMPTALPLAASLRSSWEARFGKATPKFKNLRARGIKIQIQGVGFFDFIHGQTGVAPNGFELHPVLWWQEVLPSRPPLPAPAPSAFRMRVSYP